MSYSDYLQGLNDGMRIGFKVGFEVGCRAGSDRGYLNGYHDDYMDSSRGLPYEPIKRLNEYKTFQELSKPLIDFNDQVYLKPKVDYNLTLLEKNSLLNNYDKDDDNYFRIRKPIIPDYSFNKRNNDDYLY